MHSSTIRRSIIIILKTHQPSHQHQQNPRHTFLTQLSLNFVSIHYLQTFGYMLGSWNGSLRVSLSFVVLLYFRYKFHQNILSKLGENLRRATRLISCFLLFVHTFIVITKKISLQPHCTVHILEDINSFPFQVVDI